MKCTSILNQELVISHVDSNTSIAKIIIELYETLNSTECYFNKDVWLSFLSELCEYTNVNEFINYEEIDLLRKCNDLWGDYFKIKTLNISVGSGHKVSVPYFRNFEIQLNPILPEKDYILFCQTPEIYFKYWSLFLNRKRKDLQLLHELKNYTRIMWNVVNDPNYLNGLQQIKWRDKLNSVNEFLSYENFAIKYLNGKTLREQIEFLTVIKPQVKKFGNRVIKLLEENDKLEIINYETISNLFLSELIKKGKTMCQPLQKVPTLKGGWKCVELLTHVDLHNEIDHQGHCIGGYRFDHYRSQIEKGMLRAFSFRKGNRWITVTFRKVGLKWELSEKQASAKTNARIYNTDYEKSIFEINVQIVIKALNNEKYKIEDDDF